MQNDDMAKEAVITVRIPTGLKQMLETRARKERRSLSAQIASYLERSLEADAAVTGQPSGRLLGLYQGARVPTEDELALARRTLWASIGRRKTRSDG